MVLVSGTRVASALLRRRLGRDLAATAEEARSMAKPIASYTARRVGVVGGSVRSAVDLVEGAYGFAHYVERVAGWDVTDEDLRQAQTDLEDLRGDVDAPAAKESEAEPAPMSPAMAVMAGGPMPPL